MVLLARTTVTLLDRDGDPGDSNGDGQLDTIVITLINKYIDTPRYVSETDTAEYREVIKFHTDDQINESNKVEVDGTVYKIEKIYALRDNSNFKNPNMKIVDGYSTGK